MARTASGTVVSGGRHVAVIFAGLLGGSLGIEGRVMTLPDGVSVWQIFEGHGPGLETLMAPPLHRGPRALKGTRLLRISGKGACTELAR